MWWLNANISKWVVKDVAVHSDVWCWCGKVQRQRWYKQVWCHKCSNHSLCFISSSGIVRKFVAARWSCWSWTGSCSKPGADVRTFLKAVPGGWGSASPHAACQRLSWVLRGGGLRPFRCDLDTDVLYSIQLFNSSIMDLFSQAHRYAACFLVSSAGPESGRVHPFASGLDMCDVRRSWTSPVWTRFKSVPSPAFLQSEAAEFRKAHVCYCHNGGLLRPCALVTEFLTFVFSLTLLSNHTFPAHGGGCCLSMV